MDTPRFVLLLFGGSGVDEEEYWVRSRSVPPFLDTAFSVLDVPTSLVVVHVTPPFDLPYARFGRDHGIATIWRTHVEEILSPWKALPFYVASFSGGVKLALHGVHQDARCQGAAAIAADGIPASFARPRHWRDALQWYCGENDPVGSSPQNVAKAMDLARRDAVEMHWLTSRRHELRSYLTDDCIGEIVKRVGAGLDDSPCDH